MSKTKIVETLNKIFHPRNFINLIMNNYFTLFYLEVDSAIPDPPEVPDKDRKIDRKEVQRRLMKRDCSRREMENCSLKYYRNSAH